IVQCGAVATREEHPSLRTGLPRTPRSEPCAQLLLLLLRRLRLIDRLIDPAGADTVGDGSERAWQSDVTKSISDKERSTLAVRTGARNADHQGRPVLAGMRYIDDFNR